MLENIPTIDNRFFVALITILGFVLTMVTSKGGLTNNNFTRQWWRKYTKRGRQAIGLGFLTFCILLLQENNSQNVSNFKDETLRNEVDSQNKKITEGINKGVEKSTEKLFNNLLLAFKKQGLQYDIIKNQINTLKTSNNIPPPLLHVKNLELVDNLHKWNRYNFLYEIVSDNAVSYNTNLLFDIYGFTWEGKIVALDFNQNALYKGQTVAKDLSVKGNLTIIVNYNITTYAFRLKGNYKSSDGTKIPIDEFSLLQINNNKTSLELTSQYYETALREFIKENKF